MPFFHSNIVAQVANIRGGKVGIRKEHVKIYKITRRYSKHPENFLGKTTK